MTITGAGLTGTSAISFGGVAAAFNVVSTTVLMADAPAHPAGTVPVVVTGGPGTTPRTLRFTYVSDGLPGRVGDLEAHAMTETSVEVAFSAPPGDGGMPPAPRRYVVKQASSPIADEAGFNAAHELCEGACEYVPSAVGERLRLRVNGLQPATTYYYAVRAVNDLGVAGPLSNLASATTPGPAAAPASSCAPLGPTLSGKVAYPAGYAIVGLPAGAGLGQAAAYGWFDQGAGGRYSRHDPPAASEAGRAYWAWAQCPRLVNLPDAHSARVSFPLGAYHASLVGNPASRPAVLTGHDYAARWDPTMHGGTGGYRMSQYRESLTLSVGEGVWVFSYRTTTIAITPVAM